MKRKLITILLTLLTLNVYSQTDLELAVFQKINEYRVENGLHNLKWDDATYKSTQIHTEYMIK
ncbi:MAG: CAP domain-containing protein, partial [Flavobacteriales bacterium]